MSDGKSGFVFGDHRFIHPSQNGPLDRFAAPRKQIRGAPPPTCLDGLLREATDRSLAAERLLDGRFCGHSEPTFTLFDVVIDGVEWLEIGELLDPNDPELEKLPPVFVVRGPGGEWRPVFRREWADAQATLNGAANPPLTAAEAARVTSFGKARISIGFEYPCDATTRDDVTWMTLEIVGDDESEPQTIVDAELA